MANPVMKFQILSKTPDETARFYSTLFGWAVSADNPLGYKRNQHGVAGRHPGRNLASSAASVKLRAVVHSSAGCDGLGEEGRRARSEGGHPSDRPA